MNVQPAAAWYRQGFRGQDLIEARHHDHVRPVGPQRADERLGAGVGGHLDRPAEVPRDARDQVRLGVGPLPPRAANRCHQVHPFLDQVQQECRSIIRGNSAEDDPQSPIVKRRTRVWSRRHLLEIDGDHRELGLRPDTVGEVIEPGVVKSVPRSKRRLCHAIARRTIGGRCSSSPYAQPSRSMTWTTGMSCPARCSPMPT